MTINELMKRQVDRLQMLRREKEKALSSGSPDSEVELLDLNIVSCEDAIAMYEERLKERMESCNLGARWQNRTFENFQPEAQPRAYDQCLAFAKRTANGANKSILLSGTVGTGKTHLAAAIAHYCIERNLFVLFGNVVDIFQSLKNAFSTDEDILSDIKSMQLLVLDDLGKEKQSEWTQETIYSIINYRYENMLPTVITTNLTMSDLQSRLGAATVSRLMEMCDYVEMNGSDHRII